MTILPTIVLPPPNAVDYNRTYTPTFVGRLRAIIAGAPTPPPPIADSDFNGVGRDIGHDGTNRLVSIDLAIDSKLAIAEQNFMVERVPGALRIDMPRGQHNVIADRVNINSGTRNVAYGDLTALEPDVFYTNRYAKLV